MFFITELETCHCEKLVMLLNLETKEISKSEINTDQAESYDTWLLNSRWLVFSSSRLDGLHTRFYFSHLDDKGTFTKPLILHSGGANILRSILKIIQYSGIGEVKS